MNTYVVLSTRYVKGIERWVKSLEKNLGKDVIPLIIMWKPYFEVPSNFLVYKQDTGYPGHGRRHNPLPEIIRRLGLDNWYLHTDGMDLVFQKELVNLALIVNDEVNIVSCHEGGETHGENAFWKVKMGKVDMDLLHDVELRNGGLFAMKGRTYIEFVEFLRTHNRIPDDDQVVYNKFLTLHEGEYWDNPDYLVLGSRYVVEAGIIKGLFRNKLNGHIYSIVHANGSTKPVLELIYPIEAYLQ